MSPICQLWYDLVKIWVIIYALRQEKLLSAEPRDGS